MAEMINREKTVTLLNGLIQLDFDAIAAYQAAIDRLHDAADKAQLEAFMGDHQRHVRELTPLVLEQGGVAATEADFKKVLTKGKVVIAGLVGERAVLEAMKSNEDATNNAYEKATREPTITISVRTQLEKNLSDERRHRAWIERRLASMTASSRVQDRPSHR